MSFEVLCAKCGTVPEPTDTGVRCTACGQESTRQEAQEDVQAHHDEMAGIALQRKAMQLGAEHPWITAAPGIIPSRNYKFITDLTPDNVLERIAK